MQKHPEFINRFTKGMNQDLDNSVLSNEQYRNARNIRLITEGINSSAAITNIDGNALSFAIPQISNVVQIVIPNFSLLTNFTIHGTTVNQIVADYDALAALLNADATFIANNLKAVANATQVLVYSLMGANNNITTTANITFSAFANATLVNLVPQQSPLIIGHTDLRDDFVIFTTADQTRNPGGQDATISATPSSSGQIWRLSYDKITLAPTLTLLYNNFIDFTTFRPIPPSAAEARYETAGIQRVVWSDNFNELRTFNLADPNGFALDPSLLIARAQADFDVPILQKINDSGGNLKVGVYQAAYRLKNFGGGATVYSKASNLVSLVGGAQSLPFRNIVGSLLGGISAKTITWNIDNLDTDYDRIEIVILFREKREDIPVIDQVFDEPMPGTGNFTFTYTGNEPTIPIDLNQFLNVNSAFTHCKTLVSKTNQLLAGNVRNKTFDIDFDARAYRWKHLTGTGYNPAITQVLDSQGTTLNVDTTQPNFGVPETHDAINPDQSTQNVNSYRFQSDGITLGGEGPNIKYTFKTVPITADNNTSGNGFGSMNLDIAAGVLGVNGRFTNPQPNPFTLNNNTFPHNNYYDSFKSPYKASALKGYQHDEVYRFAIRFFDKTGRAGFAKWIADIRMPLIYESLDNSLPTFRNFPISDFGSIGDQRVGVLVPEFDVTIPANLQDQISGWEIIRVERDVNNKTVLAAGTIHPMHFVPVANSYEIEPYDRYGTQFFTPETEYGIFRSPDFTFLTFPGFSQGDTIKITHIQTTFAVVDSTNPSSGTKEYFRFIKNYNESRYIQEEPLAEALFVQRGGTVSGLSSSYKNFTGYLDSGAQSVIGDDGVFLNWTVGNPVTFGNIGTGKPYALYKRPVANQYGGNTYAARSSNEYISCGHHQEITFQTSSLNFIVTLHGGDIFTTVWDTQKNIKDWSASFKGSSITYFQPVQAVVNTEWRHGDFLNKNGYPDNNTSIDVGEDYLYNTVYSAEDNTKKAFPKPINFVDVQEYDNRVHISAVKINGEETDSWSIFPALDYRDLEGSKGPVNSLHLFKDNVYAIQNDGVCIVPVNLNTVIPDNASSSLQIGTGEILSKPVYISTSEGSRHQWSCLTTDSAIYFFDIKTLEIMRVTNQAEPLAIIKGMASYFDKTILGNIITTDNPIHDTPTDLRAGILAAYDYQNGEVLYTFHDVQSGGKKASTLAYSELIDAFTSFYDFTPSVYLINKRHLFSAPDSRNVWIHGEGNKGQFYGTNFKSSINFLVNPNFSENKVFDNFEWTSEVLLGTNNQLNETWSSVQVYNDHQNSGVITFNSANLKRRERRWQTIVPRNRILKSLTSVDPLTANITAPQLFKDRIRGQFMQTELVFDNFVNSAYKELICPYIKTILRHSYR